MLWEVRSVVTSKLRSINFKTVVRSFGIFSHTFYYYIIGLHGNMVRIIGVFVLGLVI